MSGESTLAGETDEAVAFARKAVADYGRAGSVFAADRARLEAWIATHEPR